MISFDALPSKIVKGLIVNKSESSIDKVCLSPLSAKRALATADYLARIRSGILILLQIVPGLYFAAQKEVILPQLLRFALVKGGFIAHINISIYCPKKGFP